jgi:hypothetical protein
MGARPNLIRRFFCGTNLWHRWRTQRTPDGGGRFERCADCGKERDAPTGSAGAFG